MVLPSNVLYRLVNWKAMSAVADSADPDRAPDGIPLADIIATFVPAISIAKNPSAVPPVTIFPKPVVARTNVDGQLVTVQLDEQGAPIPSTEEIGVPLLCTDNPALSATGWTWTVTLQSKDISPLKITFALPMSEDDIDLTSLVEVPSNPGSQLDAWVQAVADAQAVADNAMVQLDQVVQTASFLYVAQSNVTGNVSLANVTQQSIIHYTLTGSVTITALPSSPVTGMTVTLVLIQDATGSRTVTFPAGLKWAYGLQPPVSTAGGSVDIVHIMWTGAFWVGFVGGMAVA